MCAAAASPCERAQGQCSPSNERLPTRFRLKTRPASAGNRQNLVQHARDDVSGHRARVSSPVRTAVCSFSSVNVTGTSWNIVPSIPLYNHGRPTRSAVSPLVRTISLHPQVFTGSLCFLKICLILMEYVACCSRGSPISGCIRPGPSYQRNSGEKLPLVKSQHLIVFIHRSAGSAACSLVRVINTRPSSHRI